MRILIHAVLLSTLAASGCQTPLPAPVALNTPPIASPALTSGRSYEFTLKSKTPGVTETYEGVVKQFDDGSIVITNAARTVRREAEPMPRGRFGLGGRGFRNAGVGRDPLPGDVTVRREDLVSIAPLEGAIPNAPHESEPAVPSAKP
jgi:hypothetical protein